MTAPDTQPPRSPWSQRLGELAHRWGAPATLALGAALLLFKLGATGLWEPWEMDRADLARTLVERPQVAAAVAPGEGETDLAKRLGAAAEQADVTLRLADPPAAGARGVAAGGRTVNEALELARTEVVAAVVLDLALVAPEPWNDATWTRLAGHVDQALSHLGRAPVLLVAPAGMDTAALGQQLNQARAKLAQQRAFKALGQTPPPNAPEPSDAWAQSLGDGERLQLMTNPSDAELAAALSAAAALDGWTVRFKADGVTHTVAPLETWATAVIYQLFGASEATTRLAGVLFALLALFVLMRVGRDAFGPGVGVLSGLVLLTTPLFYAQARSAAGEAGAILGLTLFAAGLLYQARGASPRTVWTHLATGLVVGFLSKGLFALMIYALMAGGAALVVGTRDRREWLPAVAAVGSLALASLWVLSSDPYGFAGQFRFTHELFSQGPSEYLRNFDYVIHQIGFGAFPWSPLYIIAMAGLLWQAADEQDKKSLLVILWFGIPVVATMAMLKSFNHLVWPAAPAGALAVGLVLKQIATRGLRSNLVALLFLIMFYILFRELRDSPRPLSAFLAFDPPFTTDAGGLRFPESVKVSSLFAYALLAAALIAATHFGGVFAFIRKAASLFARPLPFAIALGASLSLMTLVWFIRVLAKFHEGMRLPTAGELDPVQRGFASSFLASADPVVLVSWLTIAGVLGVIVVRRIFGRPLARPIAAVERLAARLPMPGDARLLMAGGGAWFALGLATLFSVSWPEGYWGEVFGDPSLLLVALATAGAAYAVWRSGVGVVPVVATALGAVGLWLGTRLGRDADLRNWYTVGLTLAGALAYAMALLPRLWRSGYNLALLGGALVAVALVGLTFPLLDRWEQLRFVLYPEASESFTRYLLVGSRASFALYVGILALVFNRFLPSLVSTLVDALSHVGRGRVVVAGLTFAGVLFTVGTVTGLYADLAYNVSQKHIMDTYREAEGLGPRELGDRIFKHGAFGTAGRKDSNFYTAAIPEIRDRNTALTALFAAKDVTANLETSEGTKTLTLPGRSGDGLSGTGPKDLRYYALVPAEQFSALNHAYRKISGGAHMPILDGRSYRVLLATSTLREGEEQQNRFAQHTLTRAQFDALKDPDLHRVWANWGDKIRVVGYKIEPAVVGRGKKFKLTTYFEALEDIPTSYKIFMHIDRPGTSNRIHGDHWPLDLTPDGDEGKVCTGCYRTDHWMKGDIVLDVFETEVPIGTPSGPQEIWMGFYQPSGGSRLEVKDWERDKARHDGQNRVRIGSFQVP